MQKFLWPEISVVGGGVAEKNSARTKNTQKCFQKNFGVRSPILGLCGLAKAKKWRFSAKNRIFQKFLWPEIGVAGVAGAKNFESELQNYIGFSKNNLGS